jgi:predicted Rossmann fold flavoprotein
VRKTLKTTIIGGGAAGMMAAVHSASQGAETVIYERNTLLGKKLALTGKGRCNLTNACSIQEFIKKIPDGGNFLYSALHYLDCEKTMDFFHLLGVELKTERGRRVFPLSDNAHTVINALKNRLWELGVTVKYGSRVDSVTAENGRIKGFYSNGVFHPAQRIIVAVGGMSYAATGSGGDGYVFAKNLGHSVKPLFPALVPLETAEKWTADIAGLSLKNSGLKVIAKGKTIYRGLGEMLFTHGGVSGPLILSASYYIVPLLKESEVRINVDLKPALSMEQLEKRVLRDFAKFTRKCLANALNELLPLSIIPPVIYLSALDPDKRVNQISRAERERLLTVIKALPLTVTAAKGFDEAIITAGGVNLKEINPKTMESKLIQGLYFCGEVLDIQGPSGGFNLQIAWSTGAAAGYYAAGGK